MSSYAMAKAQQETLVNQLRSLLVGNRVVFKSDLPPNGTRRFPILAGMTGVVTQQDPAPDVLTEVVHVRLDARDDRNEWPINARHLSRLPEETPHE